jgi:hypothetical protein
MSTLSFLGLGKPYVERYDDTWPAIIFEESALRRVLNFTRYTIDDVINDPYARYQVCGYYRLHRQIERVCDANPITIPPDNAHV